MQKTLAIVCFVQLTISFSVEGVSMSITPSFMVVGSSSVNPLPRLELRCSSDGTSNDVLDYLGIYRRLFKEAEYRSLASINLSGIGQSIPSDIKLPNISGSLLGNPATSGSLTLTDGGSITCNHQAEFKCIMMYRMTGVSITQVAQESHNFTVISAPSDFRITDALYEDKGIQLQLINDSRLTVGTRITYRCSANIGSDSSLAIAWERSSMLGASTDFTAYTPIVSTDIVQDPPVQGSCFYTRTSTMYYNMTSMDDDGITFRCKVRVCIGNQWFEPTSMHRRTFAIPTSSERSAVTTGGQEGSNVSISGVLAIVLGVLFGVGVILIVILSIFLQRYRKLTKDLQCQLQSRSQMYDGLNETVESSAPCAILNREPPGNQQQSDYLNSYDRLNRTVGHSDPYDMLERDTSDQRVLNENKPYINMEHNVL